MFSPSMWLEESFRHFTSPASPFPPSRRYMSDQYTSPPGYTSRHRKYHTHHRLPHFNSDASETDFDTDSDIHFSSHPRPPHPPPDFEHFPRTHLRLPSKTARDLHTNEILILPPSLTRLKIGLRSNHDHGRTIRVAVAGDIRLREVIRQVLPQELLGDVKSYVKTRGEWVEAGSPMKVSDVAVLGRFVMNERGEVEVRIDIGGSSGREKRSVGEAGGYGWEREMGRVERMRVY